MTVFVPTGALVALHDAVPLEIAAVQRWSDPIEKATVPSGVPPVEVTVAEYLTVSSYPLVRGPVTVTVVGAAVDAGRPDLGAAPAPVGERTSAEPIANATARAGIGTPPTTAPSRPGRRSRLLPPSETKSTRHMPGSLPPKKTQKL
jgi:hypothetical protein